MSAASGRRALLAGALFASLLLGAGPAAASHTQELMVQDDHLLIFNTPAGTAATLRTLRSLGADRVRISINWSEIAPADRPANFVATNPASYPAAIWARYDRLIELAHEFGMGVNLQLMGPAPLWAAGAATPDIAATYLPSAAEFGAFVQAVGVRYSGTYVAQTLPDGSGGGLLPRVDYWSIWNEPNNQGSLTPQWTQSGGGWIETTPSLYRSLVDAAWSALSQTGHVGDVVLIGDLAPEGYPTMGPVSEIAPLHFVRQLYCLDDSMQPLRGQAAALRGCPAEMAGFVAAHPGLFQATGIAAHPYGLSFAPDHRPTNPDFVTFGGLRNLSATLKSAFRVYGAPTPGLPLYLTEFGYETNPPKLAGVSLAQQQAYLDEADYLAYANPDVATISQFTLADSAIEQVGLIGTLQTGLEFVDGTPKPAFDTFALPIYLPVPHIKSGQRLRIWGQVRPAPRGQAQRVTVLFRKLGSNGPRTAIATLKSSPTRGFVDALVRVRRSGQLRLAWTDPTTQLTHFSRIVVVRVAAAPRRHRTR